MGRIGLCYFLTEAGNVLGEATLAKLGPDRFWFGSAAAAESHDWDFLKDHRPTNGAGGDVEIINLTCNHTILVVAGPKARALLQAVAPRIDWSATAFPFLTARAVDIGPARVMAMRVSFSGELAWELHVPNEQLILVHAALKAAGGAHGIGQFGLLAMESMRLEKGFRHWKGDLITEFDPFESGLERFVRLDKPDFVGKSALLQKRRAEHRRSFVMLDIESGIAAAHPGASIYADGAVVGTVSSAAYGHRVQQNLAMGFVDPTAADGQTLEVDILDHRAPARVMSEPPFDPGHAIMRG